MHYNTLPHPLPHAALGSIHLPRLQVLTHAALIALRAQQKPVSRFVSNCSLNTAGYNGQTAQRHESPEIKIENLPQHIAVIMDGNQRWARRQGLPTLSGHQQGVESLRSILKCCRKLDIPCLTVFALSTENFRRDQSEVAFLLGLIESVLKRELDELDKAKVRLRFIGDIETLPPSLINEIQE